MRLTHALLISVSRFKDLSDLNQEHIGARAYFEWLRPYLKTSLHSAFDSGFLATSKGSFWRSMRGFLNRLPRNEPSYSLIYVASHGFSRGENLYISCYDTQSGVEDRTGVSLQDILYEIERYAPRHHFLVICDVCRCPLVDAGQGVLETLHVPLNASVAMTVPEETANVTINGVSDFSETFLNVLRSHKPKNHRLGVLTCRVLSATAESLIADGVGCYVFGSELGRMTVPAHLSTPLSSRLVEISAIEFSLQSIALVIGTSDEKLIRRFIDGKVSVLNDEDSMPTLVLEDEASARSKNTETLRLIVEIESENSTYSRSGMLQQLVDANISPFSVVTKCSEDWYQTKRRQLEALNYHASTVSGYTIFTRKYGMYSCQIFFDHSNSELVFSANDQVMLDSFSDNSNMLAKIIHDALGD